MQAFSGPLSFSYVTSTNPHKAYAGSLAYVSPEGRSPTNRSAYSGIMTYSDSSGVGGAQEFGYSGKSIQFHYYEPGHFIYDFSYDWATWNGPLIYDADDMRLVTGDMASYLETTSPYFYYRFSSLGLVCVNPSNSLNDAAKDPSVSLTASGAVMNGGKITVTDSRPPGYLTLLDTTTLKHRCAFMCMVKMSSIQSGTLFGWHHKRYGSNEISNMLVFETEFSLRVTSTGNLSCKVQSIDRYQEQSYGQAWFELPSSVVNLRDNQKHFVHVEMQVIDHNEPFGGAEINAIEFHVYIDGYYVAKISPHLVMGVYAMPEIILLPGDAENRLQSFLPYIGATSSSSTGTHNGTRWENVTPLNICDGAIDDAALYNWRFPQTGFKPAYTYKYENNSTSMTGGPNPDVTNPSQTLAYQILQATNPSLESNLIVYGPVEHYDVDPDARVTRFKVDFTITPPMASQKVEVSYRSSATTFNWNSDGSAGREWSEWFDITALNGQWYVTRGAQGNHFQIRLKLTPSSEVGNARSPLIHRVEYWVDNTQTNDERLSGDFFLIRP